MHPEQDEAFTMLYRKHFNQIKLYIMSLIPDPHLAEELAQDTFHTALLKIDDLMSVDPPIAWLKKTAKYKVRNAQRQRMRDLKRFLSLGEPSVLPVSAKWSAEDQVIETEELRHQEDMISQMLDALSPEERHLFQRAILGQVPYGQLAEELGITLWTCQKRVQRLRSKLRKAALEHDGRPPQKLF